VATIEPAAPHRVEPVDVPALPAPWRPADAAGPPLRGCGKPLLLGCGCAATALVAGMVLLSAKLPEVYTWWVGMMRDQVLAGLPAETSVEQRSRLAAAFEAFPEALASGRLPLDLQFEVMSELNQALTSAQSGELSTEGVQSLIDALERAIAASSAPAGGNVRAERPRRPSGALA
jgi:hypothetical protein